MAVVTQKDKNSKRPPAVPQHGATRELVVSELRQAIVRGDMQPGDRLTEWAVANDLGISRGPVREGLRELEREGLIRSFRNRGAVVMGMSDDELLELLLPIRLVVERFSAVAAFGGADGGTDDLVASLQVIISEMEEAAATNDMDRITNADMAFHRRVVEAGGQGHALQVWNSIQPRIQAQLHRIGRGRHGSLEKIPGEHRALLEVLLSGDEALVRVALEQHILHDARRYMPKT